MSERRIRKNREKSKKSNMKKSISGTVNLPPRISLVFIARVTSSGVAEEDEETFRGVNVGEPKDCCEGDQN